MGEADEAMVGMMLTWAEPQEKWAPAPNAPKPVGRIAYSMSADQQLRGVPIREGDLWHLSTEEPCPKSKITEVLALFGTCIAS